jgi:hypothetical protein
MTSRPIGELLRELFHALRERFGGVFKAAFWVTIAAGVLHPVVRLLKWAWVG